MAGVASGECGLRINALKDLFNGRDISALSLASPANGAVSIDDTPEISGSGAVGTVVKFYVNDSSCSASNLIATVTIGATGTFTAYGSGITSDGGKSFSYTLTDSSGNTRDCAPTRLAYTFVSDCAAKGWTTYNASGKGTASEPYALCSPAQVTSLMATPAAWSKSYALGANINMGGLNQSTGVAPIGNTTTPFSGVFDGRGKAISSLSVSLPTTDYVGLFGVVRGAYAEIRNLRLSLVTIEGRDNTGALVGSLENGALVTNTSSTGTVWGRTGRGGLVGQSIVSSRISGSFSRALVSGNGGDPSVGHTAGGLVGYFSQGGLFNSFATGTVRGFARVGGLIGVLDGALVRDSYATGAVDCANDLAGGFVGEIWNTEAQLRNVFSTGYVAGNGAMQTIGPFVGSVNQGTLVNSRYLGSAGCSNLHVSGCNTSTGATGSAIAATSVSDFYDVTQSPLSAWDFSGGIWIAGSGAFPSLSVSPFDSATWLASGGCSAHGSDTPFAGGRGSPEQPYLICSAQQLLYLGTHPALWPMGLSFTIKADIDLAGQNHTPIGNDPNFFTGSIDGGGHVVSNLTINTPAQSYVALVGGLRSGHIKRLGMLNPVTSGNQDVGSLLGVGFSSYVVDSYVSGGSVSGTGFVGSVMAGGVTSARVERCYSASTITAGSSAAGGITGESFGAVLQDSFAASLVTDNSGANTSGPLRPGMDPVSNSFYDSSPGRCVSCTATPVGTGINVASTPGYFFSPASAPLNRWDFENVWQSSTSAYPSLRPAQ
jgi:hypothetical protein